MFPFSFLYLRHVTFQIVILTSTSLVGRHHLSIEIWLRLAFARIYTRPYSIAPAKIIDIVGYVYVKKPFRLPDPEPCNSVPPSNMTLQDI